MRVKDKLKEKLDSLTIEGKNKRRLFEHFGEENLKRLPFNIITLPNGSNSVDGDHYREIFLLSGKVQEYCTVAGYTSEPNVTEEDLKRLEVEIFKKLDELK